MSGSRVLVSAFACCPPATPGFSGGEDVLVWQLLKQIARFHEVWALTHDSGRSNLQQTLADDAITNIHFHYIGLGRWLLPLLRIQGGHQFYYYLWQIKAFFVARRLHQKINFHLFHHLTYGNDWMVSFIGALLTVPYVRGPGGGAHRTPKSLQKEYTLRGRAWEIFRSLGQWLFRQDPFFKRGQEHASAILVCNRDSVSGVPKKWADKVHLFPVSGVSSGDFSIGRSAKARQGPFHVLSAGSLIRVKGFALAIKAFKEFSDKWPESKLSIIGSGPEESRLRELVQRLGLHGTVQLTGAMPRGLLLQQMASCDVLLFPSMRDGGGTVVIEAMAVGKPVVCLDAGGPGMHINNECGIKVTPGSPQDTVRDLAQALERLYLDEELRHELGKAARQRVNQMYHWDRLGERLMEIYRPVLPSNVNG